MARAAAAFRIEIRERHDVELERRNTRVQWVRWRWTQGGREKQLAKDAKERELPTVDCLMAHRDGVRCKPGSVVPVEMLVRR